MLLTYRIRDLCTNRYLGRIQAHSWIEAVRLGEAKYRRPCTAYLPD